jgi:DNA-binding MarR family transcriptional regulator
MTADVGEDGDIAAIDEALLKLRRFLHTPATIRDGERSIELSTLLVVGAIAARPDGWATVGQISQALDVAPSTASRLVARAQAAGVIARGEDPGDARQTRLRLTEEGAALQQRALAFRHARLRHATSSMSTRQRRQFAQLLQAFADAVKDTPADIDVAGRATGAGSI